MQEELEEEFEESERDSFGEIEVPNKDALDKEDQEQQVEEEVPATEEFLKAQQYVMKKQRRIKKEFYATIKSKRR